MLLYLEIALLTLVHLAACAAACHALLTKHDPRSALGWTALLLFLPVAGLIIYLIFGISRAQSAAERIMRKLALIESSLDAQGACGTPKKFQDGSETALAGLGRRLMKSYLCSGNSVQALHNGDQAYPAMLAAIDNARKHVFLSTYIFNYGHAARQFIEALERAHQRGVDVRVILDGVGQLYSLRKPWRILAEKGIRTALFRPLSIFPPRLGINLRSHRKVLVCDNIGFTGGMNISDGNLLIGNTRKNLIQDMHFRVMGPVVGMLRKAFLLNWGFCTEDIAPVPPLKEENAGSCQCRIVVDGPGDDYDVINDLMCGAINLSRKSVRIMTPYFLPTHDLMAALRSAALRGVDIRLVLPQKNNLRFVKWATERILPTLLGAGVRVWYQNPPFAHTKLLAIDDYYSLVGSANMDSRSLRLNFELDMEIYDEDFSRQLAGFVDMTIKSSSEIDSAKIASLSLPRKLRNAAFWLFSPYL